MKLALIQFDIAWNNPKENVTRCERLVAEAINQNAEVVVLPEMFTSGFSLPTGALATECADLGRAFLEHTARTSNITIVGTLPEVTDDGRVFNTAWVFSPSGLVGSYRKVHLFSLGDETSSYSPGDSLLTVTLPGGLRCTVFICYDLRFGVPFYKTASQTDLFVVLANWPAARREHWLTLLRARAIENQAYAVGVNRIGQGGNLSYSGDSSIFAPDGELIGSLQDSSGVLVCEIDKEIVSTARKSFPALVDRRDDVYQRM